MEAQKRRFPAALWFALLMVLVILYRLEDALRVYGPNWKGLVHGTLRNDNRIWLPPSLDLFRDWVFCGIVGLAVPFFKDIKSLWLNSVTSRVAQYSYGVYVCHVPVIWVSFSLLHFGSVFVSAILTVLLTALLSFALYHLIEHPAIQLGKHLTARPANHLALT